VLRVCCEDRTFAAAQGAELMEALAGAAKALLPAAKRVCPPPASRKPSVESKRADAAS